MKMWQAIKAIGRRRDVWWALVIAPLFIGGLLIMLRAWGQLPDVQANIYAYAAKSAGLLIAIGLTHAVTHALGWNLPNEYRKWLMKISEEMQWGAFAVLCLEVVSILGTLWLLVWALK